MFLLTQVVRLHETNVAVPRDVKHWIAWWSSQGSLQVRLFLLFFFILGGLKFSKANQCRLHLTQLWGCRASYKLNDNDDVQFKCL